MTEKQRQVLLVGGSNQVAACLIPMLADRHEHVHVLSRNTRPTHVPDRSNCSWYQDIGAISEHDRSQLYGLIWIAPFDSLDTIAAQCPSLKTVLAFSSASVLTKADSASSAERSLVKSLRAGEELIASLASARSLRYVIFRPTLIYGVGLDRNLTRIARLVKRIGLFILPRDCAGQRQPVHAGDLAVAALSALLDFPSAQGVYSTGGGEQLSYQDMVSRIFKSLDRKPRILRLPLWCYRFLLRLLKCLPRFRDVNQEVVTRMSEDLVVENEKAYLDFNFRPRAFQPDSNCWRKPHYSDNVALNAASE